MSHLGDNHDCLWIHLHYCLHDVPIHEANLQPNLRDPCDLRLAWQRLTFMKPQNTQRKESFKFLPPVGQGHHGGSNEDVVVLDVVSAN